MNEGVCDITQEVSPSPASLMFAGCVKHRGELGLACSKIRRAETGEVLSQKELWKLICDLGESLRDVHDFCEPSTHRRYVSKSLVAMQRASSLLQDIGM